MEKISEGIKKKSVERAAGGLVDYEGGAKDSAGKPSK